MQIFSEFIVGVSVGVSSFTLVAISLERYFAICRPLQSRKWQTLSHAYRIILLIWAVALVIMVPIPVHTRHENKRPGMSTCREKWGADTLERIYTVTLVLLLLVIPLIAMSVSYGIVMFTLYEDVSIQRVTNGKKQFQYLLVPLLTCFSAFQLNKLHSSIVLHKLYRIENLQASYLF